MPAFGRDDVLKRDEIENVVAYVISLSDPQPGRKPAGNVEAGKAVFAANCAVCHGPDAKGKPDVGAPNLTDRYWMYGGDEGSLYIDGLGRPAGAHAELGEQALAGRSQDPRALSRRSQEASAMSGALSISSA